MSIFTIFYSCTFGIWRNYDWSMYSLLIKKSLRLSLFTVLFTVFGFTLFLILVPNLVGMSIPCMTGLSESYTDAECTLELVLDSYSLFVIAGFATAILITYYRFRGIYHNFSKILFFTIITALILCGETIYFYYRYIPYAERRVRTAPILLDTMSDPGAISN